MFPRWLTWLVVGGIGYLIITGGVGNMPKQAPVAPMAQTSTATVAPDEMPRDQPAPEAAPAAPAEPAYPSLAAATDLERWKTSLNPDYARRREACTAPETPKETIPLSWSVLTEGHGSAAQCADTIAVVITVWNANGKATYNGANLLTLGEKSVASGLDMALVGIRVGEQRSIILPPSAITRDKKTKASKALLAALPLSRLAVVYVTRVEN